jgi:hypothetical protein
VAILKKQHICEKYHFCASQTYGGSYFPVFPKQTGGKLILIEYCLARQSKPLTGFKFLIGEMCHASQTPFNSSVSFKRFWIKTVFYFDRRDFSRQSKLSVFFSFLLQTVFWSQNCEILSF